MSKQLIENEQPGSLAFQPIISYPQVAETGKVYLMTVDLRLPAEAGPWLYESVEEYPVYCEVEAAPMFAVKSKTQPAVIVHRFGSTYGPAKFYLTANNEEMTGSIRVTLSNKWGMPIGDIELTNIKVLRMTINQPSPTESLILEEEIKSLGEQIVSIERSSGNSNDPLIDSEEFENFKDIEFSLDSWKGRAKQKYETLPRWLDQKQDQDPVYSHYLVLSGLTLWAFIELVSASAQSNQTLPTSAMAVLSSVTSGVGNNLLANLIQKWYQKATEGEIVTEANIMQLLSEQPSLQDTLDSILEALEVIPQVRSILSQKEWERFSQELLNDLRKLGNLSRFETLISGNSIANLRKIYQDAIGKPTLDEEGFNQALERYLIWVEQRYGRLILRGLEQREQQVLSLTLDDLYIDLAVNVTQKLSVQRHPNELLEYEQLNIDMGQLLSINPQLIITGDPGSGKTTYLHQIASIIARSIRTNESGLVKERFGIEVPLPLPIYVSLVEYNHYRRRNSQSDDPRLGTLTDFITYSLLRQQESLTLPEDFFERLLVHGRACLLLLLDGLDEVANERERILVSQAVTNFAYNKSVRQIVLTSRTRVFQGQVAMGGEFQMATIQPMTNEKVASLVTRWCNAVYDPTQASVESRNLQESITRLEQLRANRSEPRLVVTPLMITLTAIVHYSERRLPEQRAKLYEMYVEVLLSESYMPAIEATFELADWGGTLSEKRTLLARLAYEMMSAGEETGRSVSETQLQIWLRPEFVRLAGENNADARFKVFVQAMRERGSLLNERAGSYQFTHLTFQEFLCAYYLAETMRDPARITAFLLENDRFSNLWWRETILLTVGYLGLKSLETALNLIYQMVSLSQKDEIAMAAAELAAMAFLDLESQEKYVQSTISGQLSYLLMDSNLNADSVIRLLAGDALGRLGDPRPGVGTIQDINIPDIIWGEEVPSGIYIIGDVEHQKELVIQKPYRLGKYPVTYKQFQCFVDAVDFRDPRWWHGMPEHENNHLHDLSDQAYKISNHPRENVSWYQAIAFCRWLSDKLGVLIDLPHEFEWEVAARFADNRTYPWGNEFNATKANIGQGKRLGQTSAVGIYPQGTQSQLSLFDMIGNVWEWCRNKYDEVEDATIDTSGARRVVRGGAFSSDFNTTRISSRDSMNPAERTNIVGFRIATSSGNNFLTQQESLIRDLQHPDIKIRSEAIDYLSKETNDTISQALQQAFLHEKDINLHSRLYDLLAGNTSNRDFLIVQHIERFLGSIEPTVKEMNRAQKELSFLKNNIEQNETLKDIYLDAIIFGSYQRNTAVQFVSDVDILILFRDARETILNEQIPKLDFSRHPSVRVMRSKEPLETTTKTIFVMHELFKLALYDIYKPSRRLSRDQPQVHSFGNSITMTLSGNYRIELIFGITTITKSNVVQILVPDERMNKWTRPGFSRHLSFTNDLNERFAGKYTKLVKIVKWWQHFHKPKGKFLSGFVLECLVAAHSSLQNKTLLEAFSDLIHEIKVVYSDYSKIQQIPELGASGKFKKTRLSQRKYEEFIALVDETIRMLATLDNVSNLAEELEVWRKVFGPHFPDEL